MSFKRDLFPEQPRILFIGQSESSHTRSWIDLLDSAQLNVRLFALPSGSPPVAWPVKTYVTSGRRQQPVAGSRSYFYPAFPVSIRRALTRRFFSRAFYLEERWLARVIRSWRPHIIQTIGLDFGGAFYFTVRQRFNLSGIGKWVMQLRGGSDLALDHLNPEARERKAEILAEVDYILSDNSQNRRIVADMGINIAKFNLLEPTPGTGGIDVTALEKSWRGKPSERRIIVWPKAYDSPWSLALPVLEGIKLSWDKLRPCEIYMLATTPDFMMWFWSLPEEIRRNCHPTQRIANQEVLDLLAKSRVMLAPSLVDGTPNTMFEAMAAGALPIVSPLETITAVVESEKNVLFARNLYPQEIAIELVRAMSDDDLVERATKNNLEKVKKLADRDVIRKKVIDFYESIAED